jgi:hypothetical protein
MGVIFRPHPRHALVADIHVERGRGDRDRLVQRLLRLIDTGERGSNLMLRSSAARPSFSRPENISVAPSL